jgi:hypothetical protein
MIKKNTLLTGLFFGIVIVGTAVSTAFARSHVGRGTVISGELFGRIGLCWTDPTSASGTSASPTATSSTAGMNSSSQNYGIVFAIESGNGNEIAADIYSLDSNRRKIKQIGHADVTASNSSGAYTFSGASDSPSQFSLTFTPSDYSSGQPREHGYMTAQLASAALFSGDVASGVALQCDVADLSLLPAPSPSANPSSNPSANPSANPSSSPSPSVSPSPVPSASPTADPSSNPTPSPSATPSVT